MEIFYFVVLNALGHLAFVGARMTATLFALHLGASEVEVGLLMSLFAALPMLLSVSAGRLIDHVGPRAPLLAAFAVLAFGAGLPFVYPSVPTLYVCSTLVGTSFMLVHIAMNSVFGALGGAEQRAFNVAWLALGFSISGSAGPLIAGYAIDHAGHARAFALLASFPVVALALLAVRSRSLPRPEHVPDATDKHLFDLLRVPGLRHTFVASGLLAMGWDLYAFLMPLYGTRLGFAAATIGLIMATFAIATFVVRLAMPLLVRTVRHWVIVGGALAVAGSSYLLFPLADDVAPLMGLSFLLGFGLGSAQPVIMALLYDASPLGRQSEAVGVRTTMLNASHTFIPLASGALSAAFGMAPVFWLLAAFLLGGAWFARRQVRP